ncbi:Peptidase family M23 [Actinomadura madurae]|uniref:Peptidase family M23 n=1 Tax=Actinomadura madurae TaxID=1993 RepID=A0A1I5ND08_9ACTN|nr:M23 family metallopeptidase [Actinomadura madurae]SFP19698.1 Peptidase family M23 [Actinomadura madurae]
MYRTIARFRMLFILLGLALCLTTPLHGLGALSVAGLVLIVGGIALAFVPGGAPDREPVVLQSPVRGRWIPVNSPADKVPSHGTHELGQTYAIDLVHVPSGDWRPIGRWPLAAPPHTFPAFGQDVLAPADGVVVQAGGRQRDHWSRNSWPGVLYLLLEGMVFRQLLSLLTFSAGRFIVGNSVVLDLGDGVYAVFAHLRRGSIRVRKGDRVRAGDVLGEVGNSGNSSEPHLHFHLMDRPRPLTAAGIPFAFPYDSDGSTRTGAPGARRPFTASTQPVH